MSSQNQTRFTDVKQAETLQIRCDLILEELYPAETGHPLTSQAQNALKNEYNQLYHELESIQTRPTTDPLTILPHEIWCDIIKEATTENGINLTPTDALLALTLVSRDWGTKIVNAPGLWANITVRDCWDAQTKLETGLCLSKQSPIKLTLGSIPASFSDSLAPLKGHTDRIRHIVISVEGDFDEHKRKDIIEEIFYFLFPLSSLETIQGFHGLSLRLPPIFMECPNLRHIYGMDIPLDEIPSSRGALRACSIMAPPSELMHQFAKLRQLEELKWTVSSEGIETHSNSSGSLPPFPGLKHIGFQTPPDSAFFAVLKSSENLTNLKFHVLDWKHLYELFTLFGRLIHLSVLHISLYVTPGGGDDDGWPAIKPTTTTTCFQELHIIDHIPQHARNASQASPKTLKTLEAFTDLLPIYFADVKSFHLNYASWGPGLANYIRSATRLSSLKLLGVDFEPRWMETREPQAQYPWPIESASLQKLIIVGGGLPPNSFLSSLQCPNLSRLILNTANRYQYIDNWSRQASYKHVTHLEVNFNYPWAITNFSALRTLRIRSMTYAILISLVLQPEACPSLEEIAFDMIPEWDLLFIFLEQRNYCPPSRGITRIRSLSFPLPISNKLIAPLVQILGGRFTQRPKNWELSFRGFLKTYFDHSRTGCSNCVRSMMACSAALSWDPWQLDICYEVEIPSGNFGISPQVLTWLEGREDRLNYWNRHRDAWYRAKIGRRELCKEMKLAQQPFLVTAQSSAGNT